MRKSIDTEGLNAVAAKVFAEFTPGDEQMAADYEFSARIRRKVVHVAAVDHYGWLPTDDFEAVLCRLQTLAMKAIDDRDGLIHGNDPHDCQSVPANDESVPL